MKKRILYLIVILCLVITGALYLLQKPQEEISEAPESSNEMTATQQPKAVTVSEQQQEVVIPEEKPEIKVDETISKEVLATRSMVAAHQSLREPTVADPDSKENKEILQSMVLKALPAQKSSETAPNN